MKKIKKSIKCGEWEIGWESTGQDPVGHGTLPRDSWARWYWRDDTYFILRILGFFITWGSS